MLRRAMGYLLAVVALLWTGPLAWLPIVTMVVSLAVGAPTSRLQVSKSSRVRSWRSSAMAARRR